MSKTNIFKTLAARLHAVIIWLCKYNNQKYFVCLSSSSLNRFLKKGIFDYLKHNF